MRTIFVLILFICANLFIQAQTAQKVILNDEYCKQITDYYCKQYIFDSLLMVPIDKLTEFYVSTVTVAKSGELSISLYDCEALNKRGVVFTFWNRYPDAKSDETKSYVFYTLGVDKATDLLNKLENIIDSDHEALKYINGNMVFKTNDLSFLFNKESSLNVATYPIRVWWGNYDADWGQESLRTTIKKFRKHFEVNKK